MTLFQISPKFIIDLEAIKSIAPVSGSSSMFVVFTQHHMINIGYDDFRKLRKVLNDQAMLRKVEFSTKEEEDEDSN